MTDSTEPDTPPTGGQDDGNADERIHALMATARDTLAEALKLAEQLSDYLSVEILLSSIQSDQSGEENEADGGPDSAT